MIGGFQPVAFQPDFQQQAPTPVVIPPGGSGHPVYWQGKRRKRKLIDQPLKHLDYILKKVVAEYYADIVSSDLPLEVKREAAEVVEPFVQKPFVTKSIPQQHMIDWRALQQDADRISLLLQIWNEELQAINDDDEFMMMH